MSLSHRFLTGSLALLLGASAVLPSAFGVAHAEAPSAQACLERVSALVPSKRLNLVQLNQWGQKIYEAGDQNLLNFYQNLSTNERQDPHFNLALLLKLRPELEDSILKFVRKNLGSVSRGSIGTARAPPPMKMFAKFLNVSRKH